MKDRGITTEIKSEEDPIFSISRLENCYRELKTT